MRNDAALLTLSSVGGVAITVGLLLAINLQANYRVQAQSPRPPLVVDLMNWPTPAAPPQPQLPAQPAPPKPEVKKPLPDSKPKSVPKPKPEPKPATVAKQVVAELPKPVQPELPPVVEAKVVNDAPPSPVPPSPAVRAQDSLPTPVPIFQLTQTPHFLHREVPRYPEAMRAQGVSGVVKLEVLIDKAGRVREVRILKSAGPLFDEVAKRAIFASSFSPAKVEDEAVAVLLRLPVKFSLN